MGELPMRLCVMKLISIVLILRLHFIFSREKIEFQKRIKQQRIINTESEFHEKYNKLRNSLLNDSRLTLDADFRQKQLDS